MSPTAQTLSVSTPGPADRDRVWQLADSIGTPFASLDNGRVYVRIADGSWVLPLRSSEFRELIHAVWLTAHDRPPRDEHLRIARHAVSGRALFGGETPHRVHLRLARSFEERDSQVPVCSVSCDPYPSSVADIRRGGSADAVTIDLANGREEFVHITRDGWRVTTETNHCFLRAPATGPMPTPVQPASPGRTPALDRIRELLRIPRNQWPRVLAWLLAALHPGPDTVRYHLHYPILALHGPAESGASSAAFCLRNLIDPNAAGFVNHLRTETQILRLALSGWVLAYDGIDRLSERILGTLGRISSSASYDLRDPGSSESYYFTIARPQIVTLRTTAHTASSPIPRYGHRTLVIGMDTIPRAEQRTHNEILTEFAGLAPQAFGELCTAVSAALSDTEPSLPDRRLVCLDTSLWAISATPALGIHPQEMTAALAVPPKPIVAAVEQLFAADPVWKGSPTALAHALPALPGVPTNPIALSRLLNASLAELAESGISISVERNMRSRTITLAHDRCYETAKQTEPKEELVDLDESMPSASKAQAA